MTVRTQLINGSRLTWTLRCPEQNDASELSKLRVEIDGETENLETNTKAIELYKKFGFVQEGLLRRDRKLKDGQYYNTVLKGRLKNVEEEH